MDECKPLIVGSVAESGIMSNVSDAYSQPDFDVTVDKDGITGFRTKTILTCPVKNDQGKVIAVVQLVNKNKKRNGQKGRLIGRQGLVLLTVCS